MTPEELSAIAGIILSVVFSYVPWLRRWFDGLDPDYRRLVMLGLLCLVATGAYFINYGLEYVPAAAWEYIKILIAAIIANQSAYAVSPRLEPRARG